MIEQSNGAAVKTWVKGELELAGILDRRMIALLQAIEQTGSINQAARQVGLSYKGAWQIIERANSTAPKALIHTATGGSKGGGTALTKAGLALLALFADLEQQHQQFLQQINQRLAEDADILMLLQRLAVNTTARNQLFGKVLAIQSGAVNAELSIALAGGQPLVVTIDLATLQELNLQVGGDTLLIINDVDIVLVLDATEQRFSARNCLACQVRRIEQSAVNAEVIVSLDGGETLVIVLTRNSLQQMGLAVGMSAWVIFKSNAPILGVAVLP